MSYAIVVSSRTGNTKKLADIILDTLKEKEVLYCGEISEEAKKADVLFIGFWTDKGTCDEPMQNFLHGLKGKQIFLFGTAGFGQSQEYFHQILERVKKEIPSPAQLIGDTTYVPIRAVSEALGATVGWDAATNSAGIYTYNKSHTMSIVDYRVTIGQTTDELFSICGAPSYSLIGENGLMWHVYAVYAPAFMMVASDAGIVCGYYTNSTLFTTSEGLSYGSAAVSKTDQYEYVKIDNINIHK